MNSYSFLVDSTIFGVAEDVLISTTSQQIPMFGSGPLGDGKFLDTYASVSFHNLRVYIIEPAASAITVDVVDVTTSTNLGSFTIPQGSMTGSKNVASAFSVNPGDQLFLTVSVASSQIYVPRLHWYVG
jgi:hypothetical protein